MGSEELGSEAGGEVHASYDRARNRDLRSIQNPENPDYQLSDITGDHIMSTPQAPLGFRVRSRHHPPARSSTATT